MRAHEFTDHRVMAKIERTGQIVQILRRADQVGFSDEPGWFLINTEPGRRTGTGIKWIPDSTRFAWVRNFDSLKETQEGTVQSANVNGLDLEAHVEDDTIQVTAYGLGKALGRVLFVADGQTL